MKGVRYAADGCPSGDLSNTGVLNCKSSDYGERDQSPSSSLPHSRSK